jgi:hypothetical protein
MQVRLHMKIILSRPLKLAKNHKNHIIVARESQGIRQGQTGVPDQESVPKKEL